MELNPFLKLKLKCCGLTGLSEFASKLDPIDQSCYREQSLSTSTTSYPKESIKFDDDSRDDDIGDEYFIVADNDDDDDDDDEDDNDDDDDSRMDPYISTLRLLLQ